MAEAMAMDLKDKFLACPVCVEHFNQTDRSPRILQACFHSCCTKCLQQLLDKGVKGEITCPLCHQVQKIKGKADNLPLDPVRSNLVEYLQIKDQKKVACTDCPDGGEAESKCQDCMAYLCTDCASAHRRNHVTRHHKLVSSDEMLEEPAESFFKGHFCSSHPKQQLEIFCNTCECMCCVSCKEVDHQGHKIDKLDKVSSSRREELERMLLDVQSQKGHLKQAMSKGQRQQERLQSAETKAVRDINTTFDHLEELINRRRAALLDEVHHRSDEMLSAAKETTSACEERLERMASVQTYFAQAKENADEVELLQIYPCVKKSMSLLSDKASSQDLTVNKDILQFQAISTWDN